MNQGDTGLARRTCSGGFIFDAARRPQSMQPATAQASP